MLKSVNRIFKPLLLAMIGLVFLCGISREMGQDRAHQELSSCWKLLKFGQNGCKASFPTIPEHRKRIFFMEKEQKIFCDFYRSIGSGNTQYLMVVSSYCSQEMEGNQGENQGRSSLREQISRLEMFLNHCMKEGTDHQLEFADLTQVQGYCALDFSLLAPRRSRIKGRAIITKDSFYVLAMQCHPKRYVDNHFSHFIKSFQILHVSPDS